MTVVLIGAPASGKSRIGRKLAKRLGRPFIDTDKLIVAEHGPIADIFATLGEPYFRTVEREMVKEALTSDAVVSLGGGAVLDADTQSELDSRRVVLLTVAAEVAAPRLGNGKRPLVTSVEAWRALVDARAELYASLADFTIDTSTRPVASIVEEIAEWVEGQD